MTEYGGAPIERDDDALEALPLVAPPLLRVRRWLHDSILTPALLRALIMTHLLWLSSLSRLQQVVLLCFLWQLGSQKGVSPGK